MSQSTLWMRGLVLSSIFLCIAFAVRASGTPDKGALVMGVVDITKIEKSYKEKATVESDLKVMQNKLDGALQRRNDLPFLSEAEHQELDKLFEKQAASPLTDPEKKKVDEFTSRGNQLAGEVQALKQKDQKDLTEPDKKRLKDAEEQWTKAQDSFAAKKLDRDNQLKQFISEKSELLDAKVKVAVSKIAEQKGITIVFNSQLVLYAGTDITKPVIDELNKK